MLPFAVITSYSIHYTKVYETSPKTRRISFQLPNCAASKPASGAPSIDPNDFINWEKLSALEARFEGTTITSSGFADTWMMVLPIPKSAKPNRSEGKVRITSYNVCYTKLLRD